MKKAIELLYRTYNKKWAMIFHDKFPPVLFVDDELIGYIRRKTAKFMLDNMQWNIDPPSQICTIGGFGHNIDDERFI